MTALINWRPHGNREESRDSDGTAVSVSRDGTAEPVSRDQSLRRAIVAGNIHFLCSSDHEQDWPPYPVDPCSAICDDLNINTSSNDLWRVWCGRRWCITFGP